mmetsp:Transcript_15528/g.29887  ORF Transcript_15528/g.29887 Transcript_15528/m.29887 type:complete len:363 (-) Transcript_15528:212-1300(-)
MRDEAHDSSSGHPASGRCGLRHRSRRRRRPQGGAHHCVANVSQLSDGPRHTHLHHFQCVGGTVPASILAVANVRGDVHLHHFVLLRQQPEVPHVQFPAKLRLQELQDVGVLDLYLARFQAVHCFGKLHLNGDFSTCEAEPHRGAKPYCHPAQGRWIPDRLVHPFRITQELRRLLQRRNRVQHVFIEREKVQVGACCGLRVRHDQQRRRREVVVAILGVSIGVLLHQGARSAWPCGVCHGNCAQLREMPSRCKCHNIRRQERLRPHHHLCHTPFQPVIAVVVGEEGDIGLVFGFPLHMQMEPLAVRHCIPAYLFLQVDGNTIDVHRGDCKVVLREVVVVTIPVVVHIVQGGEGERPIPIPDVK